MPDLIIPTSSPRGSHPLRDALRARSERTFRHDVELSDVLSLAVQQWAKKRRTRNPEVLGALLTAMCSAVQAMAPPEEWGEVAVILAEELRGRLTVRQVN